MKTTKKHYVESFVIPPCQGGAKPYVDVEIDGETIVVPRSLLQDAIVWYLEECCDIGEGMQDFLNNDQVRQHIDDVVDYLELCRGCFEDMQDAVRVREYRKWRRAENEKKTRAAELAAERERAGEEARLEQKRLGEFVCHFVPRKSFPKSHQVVFTASLNGHRPFEWRGYVPLAACSGFTCPVRTMARAAARAAEKWPSDTVVMKLGPWVFRRKPGEKGVVIEDARHPATSS